MFFSPDIHHRRSIRLQTFDYSQACLCFVTICTHDRLPLFGTVAEGEMVLNAAGEIAQREWQKTVEMRSNVVSDVFVVMPDHVHGIVNITQAQSGRVQHHATLGDIVRGYKSAVTRQIAALHFNPDGGVWQRNYYEHVIRHEKSYLQIAEYIQTNPLRWQDDIYHVL